MKSFGVMWFIILLDKSTVIKDGLIRSPLNETNFLFEFTVPIFCFYVFENLSKLCSAPGLFSGTKRNSFRVVVFWFRTSWWFLFYMVQLVPKRSFESASRQSWAHWKLRKSGPMKVTPDKRLTLKIAWPCWGQGHSGQHKYWYNFSSLVGFNEGIILLHPYS